MNHVYRVIWSNASASFVAVAEVASSRGKRSLGKKTRVMRALLAAGIAAASMPSLAAPTGGQVTAGQASITQNGAVTNINQTSQNTSINWQRFDIGSQETVNFLQPSAASIAVNRVLGSNASSIYGKLNANGQVFLINPNGVLFGKDAQVNVGGLVASTLDLDDKQLGQGKLNFSGTAGSIGNEGVLSSRDGGYIALLGGQISNRGTIQAHLGTAALGAGRDITLDFAGDKLLSFKVNQAAAGALVDNAGHIDAQAGRVLISAPAADALMASVVNNSGIIEANSLDGAGGLVHIDGDLVSNTGNISADGKQGGDIRIASRSLLQAGKLSASGELAGGQVTLAAGQAVAQTADGDIKADGQAAGAVSIDSAGSAVLSGGISAGGGQGGKITITADDIRLAATTLDASGSQQGGQIRIGGDYQGSGDLRRATTTTVNPYTQLKALGDGGKIIVWSDKDTEYSGQAETGKNSLIEVSGKQNLSYGGQTKTGEGGQVLMDPANLTITSTAQNQFYIDLGPYAPTMFLSNGNVVLTNASDGFAASNAGAAYLYNGKTGSLISMVTGSVANDRVGDNGAMTLSDGNYVIRSSQWNGNLGALTWGSGTAGVSGVITGGNSLVGTYAGDKIGAGTLTEAGGNNYLVSSTTWNGNRGIVTLVNGSAGLTGTINPSASVVGSTAGDSVGSGGVSKLSSGAFLVLSPLWGGNKGAATWWNATAGLGATVSSANSLVGGTAGDKVGSGSMLLKNGNYLLLTPTWNGGMGAVTWGNGAAGTSGVVGASNSLVGSAVGDSVGASGITTVSLSGVSTTAPAVYELANGNYLVQSAGWNSSTGAVTWGSGTAGVSGTISSGNSLVGSQSGDHLGLIGAPSATTHTSGVFVLANGNYVVGSTNWSGSRGAVTYGNGSTGTKGTVDSGNSLVGSQINDSIGSGLGLLTDSSGSNMGTNYLVVSPNWNGGMGAVTWVDGSVGRTGTVNAGNSLVGSVAGDSIGSRGWDWLSNGGALIYSPYWNGTPVQYPGIFGNKGAVTKITGPSGAVGTIDSSNSLVGTAIDDSVGVGGGTRLANGNFVLKNVNWDGGYGANYGAMTFVNIGVPLTGTVNFANSLIGQGAGFQGASVVPLANGNYLVVAPNWSVWANGTVTGQVGAVTWGNGSTGVAGKINSANSLIGATAGDGTAHGLMYVVAGNGTNNNFSDYFVVMRSWNGGMGAIAVGNASTGTSGVISASNALTLSYGLPITKIVGIDAPAGGKYVGGATNDIIDLGNRQYLLDIANWHSSTLGSVTLLNAKTGISGSMGPATSLVGSSTSDNVGNTVYIDSSGNYLVQSTAWKQNGTTVGALTWANGATGVRGTIDSTNSWTGTTKANIGVVFDPNSGNYITTNPAAYASAPYHAWLVPNPANLSAGVNQSLGNQNVSPTAIANAAVAGSTVTLQADNAITVNSPIAVNGALKLLAGGAMTLNAGITSQASGDAIVLKGGSFVNNVGSNALTTPNGRWLVWSANPALDNRNGLAYNFKQYNAVYGNTPVLGTGNGFLYSVAPQISVGLTGSVSRIYDGTSNASLTGLNYQASGMLDGDVVTVTAGTSASFDNPNAGTGKTVTATGVSIANAANGTVPVYGYQVAGASASGAIGTITPASLTVTANPQTKIYDGLGFSGGNGVTYAGFVNGETAGVLGGSLGYAGNSQGAKNVGSYVITPAGLTSNNYAISYGNGTLTINPASLTVTANSFGKTYDGLANNGGNGATYSGLVNGETAAVLGGTLAYGGTSQGAKNAGTYTVIPSGLSSSNYAISYANGTFTINPAPLTVTANSFGKTYDGLAYSGGNGASYSGLVNGETTGVLGGTLAFGGTSQGAKNAGSYTVIPSGLTSSNYAISYANGTLTINPAPLTVTANSFGKTYDGLSNTGGNGATYSGFVNGETAAVLGGALAYGGTSQGATNAGAYTVIPSGLSSSNYAISYANGTFTINPAPLTVTANSISKTYDGLAYSGGNGVSYSGFVNGETPSVLAGTLSYSGTSQGAINAGTYSITPGNLNSSNYAITFQSGNLVVVPAPLTIAANSFTKTYDSAPYQGGNGVSYRGFVNGETSSVLGGSLTYGGSSQGAVSPGTYVIAPGGYTSTNYQIAYVNGQLTIVDTTGLH